MFTFNITFIKVFQLLQDVKKTLKSEPHVAEDFSQLNFYLVLFGKILRFVWLTKMDLNILIFIFLKNKLIYTSLWRFVIIIIDKINKAIENKA